LKAEGVLSTAARAVRSVKWHARHSEPLIRAVYSLTGMKAPWNFDAFDVHLTDHCNLNCAGCNHFSPLCREGRFADLGVFARDMGRMSALFADRSPIVHLLGGEPMLHPDVEKFLPIARAAFPKSVIQIVTNGLLLPIKRERERERERERAFGLLAVIAE
jgi:hypothetical protein